MTNNPFPGPVPYGAGEHERFFGREDLAYRLQGSVLGRRCVTVYGPPGAGRSSLIRAALIPTLIREREAQIIRVDSWPEWEDPIVWLGKASYTDLSLSVVSQDLSPEDLVITAAQRAARRSPRIMVLYLDRIEQLLQASRDAAQVDAFFECLNRLAALPLRNVRLVFSLREDLLGLFRDRLRDLVRLLEHSVRVGPLTVAEMADVACRIAAAGTPPQAWSPDETLALMRELRAPGQASDDEAEVLVLYAQIVCKLLFQERAEGGGAGPPSAEALLGRYVDEALDALDDLEEPARRLLREHFVALDGRPALRREDELRGVLPANELETILRSLERAAILRPEERPDGRTLGLGHAWMARQLRAPGSADRGP